MHGLSRRTVCCAAIGAALVAAVPAYKTHAKVRPFCRFSVEDGWTDEPSEYITRKARPNDQSGIPEIVGKIKSKFGIDAEIDIYIAENDDSAFATVAGGRKILVVDVGFLEKVNRRAGTEWGAIQVVAHEVGHHIAGFSQNRHVGELNADYWSGQSLQRLGSSRVAAARAILTYGTEYDTHSHPNRTRRAKAIQQGWDDAARDYIDYSFCINCR